MASIVTPAAPGVRMSRNAASRIASLAASLRRRPVCGRRGEVSCMTAAYPFDGTGSTGKLLSRQSVSTTVLDNDGKPDTMSFDGQCVVIIGASGGIGEETAKAFAERGAAAIITGRSKERLDQAAQRIGLPVQAAEVDATARAALDA